MSDEIDSPLAGRLLSLPSEVRLLIYELILPPSTTGLYAAAAKRYSWGDPRNPNQHPALLATCRKIYTEANPVLYENTEFHVRLTWPPDTRDNEEALWEDPLSEGSLSLSKHSLSEGSPSEDSLSEGSPPKDSLARNPNESAFDGEKRRLIDQMRKLYVCVDLPYEPWDLFVNPEVKREWYGMFVSKLTSLAGAPHLKKLHIEIDLGNFPVPAEVEHTISLISRVAYRVNPTISISSPYLPAEFDLSVYFDMLAKMNWVDTTPEIYSTKLADLTNESLRILQRLQSRSTSVATKSAEHRDMVNSDNFHIGDSDLMEQARSISAEIKQDLHQISNWEIELQNLAGQISRMTEVLEWVTAERSSYASYDEAKAAVSDEALTVVD